VTGRSFVQRSHNECDVSECNRGTSKVRMPMLTRAVHLVKKKSSKFIIIRIFLKF
jgi:hypothetical protein